MGIQIKLKGVFFNNPDLPVLPTYGFEDTFNRADSATLGSDWHIEAGSGTPNVGIAGNAAFIARSGTLGPIFASRESNLSNPTVETRVTALDGGSSGLALRAESITNYIRFNISGTVYRLEKVVDNVTTSVWVSGSGAQTGDVIKAVLNGPSITLYANGALLTTQTIPELVGNTRHGLYTNGGPGVRFDYCTAIMG